MKYEEFRKYLDCWETKVLPNLKDKKRAYVDIEMLIISDLDKIEEIRKESDNKIRELKFDIALKKAKLTLLQKELA